MTAAAAGMAATDMAATATPSAAKATASAADISAATAAVVSVTVAAIVVVAAAAERTANYPGNDTADDRRTSSRIIAIVNLLDVGAGPHLLQCGRVDWCGRGWCEA